MVVYAACLHLSFSKHLLLVFLRVEFFQEAICYAVLSGSPKLKGPPWPQEIYFEP